MVLEGKKIAFLGDSITAGYGASSEDCVYWRILEKREHAVCYGYGISGTRIAKNRKVSENPNFDKYFASRIDEMVPDADIVVIFGGTNDFGHGDAPLGNPRDRTPDTFHGAMHDLLTNMIMKYPQSQIVFMTPLHRLNEDIGHYNPESMRYEGRLSEYVAIIRNVCGYYGIPVLDTHTVSGLQPQVPILQELYMPDGLHPNDRGHLRIAEKLIGFLKSL